MEGASFYDRVGGAPAIKEAVERLYRLILGDPELAGYFDNVDMPKQKAHLAALLAKVLGGPDGYAGRDLAVAHEGLGITVEHYAKVGGYLVGVLRELGVDEDIVAAVAATLAAVRDQIVAQPA